MTRRLNDSVSVSDKMENARRRRLTEDETDVRAFTERAHEKSVPLEKVLKQLKAKGRMQARERKMKSKTTRDREKIYSTAQFVAKLRRFAEALEKGKRFRIQIAGERVYVPVHAQFNIEHEREDADEEIEFQIHWRNV